MKVKEIFRKPITVNEKFWKPINVKGIFLETV